MSLDAIREYIQLSLKWEDTKPARKEILLEAKEDLEKRISEMQNSSDVINYKLNTYDKKCGPISVEMVKAWKDKSENKD